MFNILSKEFVNVGNKTKCTLKIEFNKNIKLLHQISLVTTKRVEFDFIKKHQNIVTYDDKFRPIFTIIGTTTCNVADKFDGKKGEQIAFYKALKKLNKYEWELINAYQYNALKLVHYFVNLKIGLELHSLKNNKTLKDLMFNPNID